MLRDVIQHQVEHQVERSPQIAHVVPVPQRRIHRRVIDDRKAVVRRVRKEGQQVDGAEHLVKTVAGQELLQRVQRAFPRRTNVIAVGDQHDVAFVPPRRARFALPGGLRRQRRKSRQPGFPRRPVDLAQPLAEPIRVGRLSVPSFDRRLQVLHPGDVRDQDPQPAAQHRVAEKGFAQFVVVIHHLVAVVGLFDHPPHVLDDVAGQVAVHGDRAKPFGLDVADENRVAIDEDRFAVVEGFQQGVPEALVQARVGDEIGLRIGVGQGVAAASLGVQRADVADVRVYEPQVDALLLGHFLQRPQVLVAFVARFMGNDEFAAGIVQPRHQIDGMLDPFAGDHAASAAGR